MVNGSVFQGLMATTMGRSLTPLLFILLMCVFGGSPTPQYGSQYNHNNYGGASPSPQYGNRYHNNYGYPRHIPPQTTEPPHVNHRTREKMLLDEILGNGTYDRKIRPSSVHKKAEEGDFTTVIINIMIRSINKIDDYHMEYSVQMTFREQWNDDRLNYSNEEVLGAGRQGKINYLTLTETDKIWMPDLFFKNEKTGHFHDIILPNTYIRIFPNGDVLYSIRISLTLSCPMNLKLYPLDTQVCQLLMASYGWTTEDLLFLWEKNEPIQVTKNLHLPRFTLEKFIPKYCNSKTNTGEYSCLQVNLIFKREFSYYLIQYYIPCCMLVIVSWVSFWLDQHAVPARVALGVTTLLTMSTQNAGINQSLPPVSYTKAIDVWTGVCLTFVFGALLEFALVNYASRSDMHRDQYKRNHRHWEEEHAACEATASRINRRHWDEDNPSACEAASMIACPPDRGEGSYGGGHGREFHHDNLHSPDNDGRIPDYHGIVRERVILMLQMENGVPAFAMRPLVPPFREGGPHGLRSCEVHLQGPSVSCWRSWLAKFPTRSKRIDVIARITFPLIFALFNVAYWSAYLFREEDKHR
ncbi:glutamate-gated chloride channel-like isoform X4 [Macrobrachium nipponense]|uniref:glutamate-gated chloride channel-like isoform X4 n=1 Tax=Macrobrachium nipponense TaxID=159736 RepID=UPI0030C8C68C